MERQEGSDGPLSCFRFSWGLWLHWEGAGRGKGRFWRIFGGIPQWLRDNLFQGLLFKKDLGGVWDVNLRFWRDFFGKILVDFLGISGEGFFGGFWGIFGWLFLKDSEGFSKKFWGNIVEYSKEFCEIFQGFLRDFLVGFFKKILEEFLGDFRRIFRVVKTGFLWDFKGFFGGF